MNIKICLNLFVISLLLAGCSKYNNIQSSENFNSENKIDNSMKELSINTKNIEIKKNYAIETPVIKNNEFIYIKKKKEKVTDDELIEISKILLNEEMYIKSDLIEYTYKDKSNSNINSTNSVILKYIFSVENGILSVENYSNCGKQYCSELPNINKIKNFEKKVFNTKQELLSLFDEYSFKKRHIINWIKQNQYKNTPQQVFINFKKSKEKNFDNFLKNKKK